MLGFLATFGLALRLMAGTPSDVQSVVTANNQFAFDLYKQLRTADGNLFLSPYSINKTLAMVYAGARGGTAQEMAGALHFNLKPDRLHRAFLETRKLLNRPGGGKMPWARPDVQLYLSANLWGQRGYGFRNDCLKLLRECYGAGLQEVDFKASEAARKAINAWALEQTNRKIAELFPAGTIDPSTRLVLASAIYFKGDWVHPFKKNRTYDAPFWITAQHSATVPMMNQTENFGYFENDQLQALQMPYLGKDQAMVVLLPKKPDGLADLEKALTAEALAGWVSRVREQKVEVFLPRFKLTSRSMLKEALVGLGMRKAFTIDEAELSGMNGSREPLFISAVMHQAFVEVNEKGTEAAAATGAVVAGLAMPARPVIPVFRADHPFVFAICDTRTGVILFLGRVVRP